MYSDRNRREGGTSTVTVQVALLPLPVVAVISQVPGLPQVYTRPVSSTLAIFSSLDVQVMPLLRKAVPGLTFAVSWTVS